MCPVQRQQERDRRKQEKGAKKSNEKEQSLLDAIKVCMDNVRCSLSVTYRGMGAPQEHSDS